MGPAGAAAGPRRLGSRCDLRTVIRLALVCTAALAVVDRQMAGMLYRYQSDWPGPLPLAAALAWLFAESGPQARSIPALTKALRTACRRWPCWRASATLLSRFCGES